MHTKVTRQRIDTHLEYDWFKYILILIAAIALWIFAFQILNASRNHEQINVFVAAPERPNVDVSRSLAARFDGTHIRETHVAALSPFSQGFNELLLTRGMHTSDILILPSLIMTHNSAAFVEFDEGLIYMLGADSDGDFFESEYFGGLRGIRVDNLPRAYAVFNFDIIEAEEGEEPLSWYLVFNLRSVNIGGYNSRSRPEHTQAIEAARFLLDMMR